MREVSLIYTESAHQGDKRKVSQPCNPAQTLLVKLTCGTHNDMNTQSTDAHSDALRYGCLEQVSEIAVREVKGDSWRSIFCATRKSYGVGQPRTRPPIGGSFQGVLTDIIIVDKFVVVLIGLSKKF